MALPNTITIQLDWSQIGAPTYRQIGEEEYAEGPSAHPTPETFIASAVASELAAMLKRDTEFYGGLRREVDDLRKEMMRERVDRELDQLFNSEIQPTNSLGEARGSKITLREMVVQEARDALTRDRGDYRNKKTLLSETISKVTEAALRKELSDELAKIKAQLGQIITSRAAAVLGQALVEQIGKDVTAETAKAVTAEPGSF